MLLARRENVRPLPPYLTILDGFVRFGFCSSYLTQLRARLAGLNLQDDPYRGKYNAFSGTLIL